MNINVDISEEQYKKLLEEAKEEIRTELTRDALLKYLKEDCYSMSMKKYLYSKAECLEDKLVKDLTRDQKAILALSWLLY